MSSHFESDKIALVRRNRIVLVVALVPIAFAVLLLVHGLDFLGAMFCGAEFLIAAFILWIVSLRHADARITGRLVVGVDDITWDGRSIAQRRTLSAGFLVPWMGLRPLVKLTRHGLRRTLWLEVPDMATGRALLQALDLDVTQVTAQFRFVSRALVDPRILYAYPFILLSLLFAVGWFGLPVAALAAVGPTLFVVWLVALLLPTRATVGVDGILIAWMGRRQFLPYSEVRAVRPFGYGQTVLGVSFWRAVGKAVKLPIGITINQKRDAERIHLIIGRILDAMASGRNTSHIKSSSEDTSQDADVALPRREDRSTVEWVRALRFAGSEAHADHRTAPIAPERLLRIAEDPAADEMARATAAMALSSASDPDIRGRLRIAAHATASPEISAVLKVAAEEAAAEEELAAVLDALTPRHTP